MSTNCDVYTPVIQSEDPCGGDKKSSKCVVNENAYTQLGLGVNASQEDFNQAIYVAFLTQKGIIEELQAIIENL